MTEWVERQSFSYGDINDIDGKPLLPITTAVNASGSITPPIVLSEDYFLRDDNGELITTEIGDSISLEGMI